MATLSLALLVAGWGEVRGAAREALLQAAMANAATRAAVIPRACDDMLIGIRGPAKAGPCEVSLDP
jgi:hypothetical protein